MSFRLTGSKAGVVGSVPNSNIVHVADVRASAMLRRATNNRFGEATPLLAWWCAMPVISRLRLSD